MKKYLIIALTAALLLAFFGCGDPPEDGSDNKGPDLGDHTEIPLTLPAPTSEIKDNTGESNSKMYTFEKSTDGEDGDFEKIKKAVAGSFLRVTYKAPSGVNYACAEIGWKSITDAGPVIGADGKNKNQEVYVNKEDLVIGTNDFTVHMFNGAVLLDVTLFAAPAGYKPKANEKATAGGKKIFIPTGLPVDGNGDLSKAAYKMITNAAGTASVVFYFDDKADTTAGILKFGPKSGDPYKHYGISKDGAAVDGDGGWRALDDKKTITYTVDEINAAIATAKRDYPSGVFNKLEINQGSEAKAELLYIELVGDEPVSCTCD